MKLPKRDTRLCKLRFNFSALRFAIIFMKIRRSIFKIYLDQWVDFFSKWLRKKHFHEEAIPNASGGKSDYFDRRNHCILIHILPPIKNQLQSHEISFIYYFGFIILSSCDGQNLENQFRTKKVVVFSRIYERSRKNYRSRESKFKIS